MEAWKEELYHHGILGQKWGIRRFQNYNGSYTQEGRRRYGIAREKLIESAKNYGLTKYSRSKGEATKEDVNKAKNAYKESKKEFKQEKKLYRYAYRADLGKKLFDKGIVEAQSKGRYLVGQALTAVGGMKAADARNKYYNYMKPMYNTKPGNALIALGTLAAMAGRSDYRKDTKKNLKAYYKYRDIYGDLG